MLQRDLHRDQRSLERLKPLVPGAAVALCPDDHYVVGPATTYVSDQIATSHNPVFAPPSPMMIQPTDFIRKVNHTGSMRTMPLPQPRSRMASHDPGGGISGSPHPIRKTARP
ncbi:hypothetical protein HYQ45_013969 [Verticillium longisporum]|uniref:Uncharacterized protein n=1 Tax=Verticillium longisporum TaxID=100787 RepID=A0A8I3ALG4_VERLO|nr:hypothetical protein HYQ45_013969 [Verticillium longisporum]